MMGRGRGEELERDVEYGIYIWKEVINDGGQTFLRGDVRIADRGSVWPTER
jgi:hypothetical protein